MSLSRLARHRSVVAFALIGGLSTILYAALYLALRTAMSPSAANALALAVTAVANTQANRHFTFGVRGRDGLMRHHFGGALVYLLALAVTDGALAMLRGVSGRPSHGAEVATLVAANALATILRYVALRLWVFGRGAAPAQV